MAQHLEDRQIGTSSSAKQEPSYRWEPSPRRVRAVFGDETVVDSTHVMLLIESEHLPVFYFPRADVRMELLEPSTTVTSSPLKGEATYWTLRVGGRVAEDAAWSYENPPPGAPDMKGYVAFYWSKMDAWYEEEERAYAHARDPYKLVDTRQSTRHVRVLLGGAVVAESRRPLLLFETGLPVRYYLPREDVRMDLLTPTSSKSQCAYKGEASYWTARIGDQEYRDVAWSYEAPTTLVAPVAGLVCFYNERVDAVEVDGQVEEKPHTQWS
ncbi:MAG TPA: DUF427 domain-containing protein [Ktedonobacterales bacterium]